METYAFCKNTLEHLSYKSSMEINGEHSITMPFTIDEATGLNTNSKITQDELLSRVESFKTLYVDLLDLNRMRQINREATRKIVKKFDKVSGEKTLHEFMRDEIDTREFGKEDALKEIEEQLLSSVRILYSQTDIGEREFQRFRGSTILYRQNRLNTLQKSVRFQFLREFLPYIVAFVFSFIILYVMVQPQFASNPMNNWQGYVVIYGIFTGVILIAVHGKPADVCLTSVNILFLTVGIINSDEAFAGFSNAGVIANGILLPFARALSISGGAEYVLIRCLGKPSTLITAQLRMCLVVAALSSVLNNTPIVIMMIPILQTWCSRLNMSVSKFMLPMSFAIMLGGTCSIVGSSANLVTIGMASSYHGKFAVGSQPIYSRPGFWTPAIIGLPVMLIGTLWMIFTSTFLLPCRIPASGCKEEPSPVDRTRPPKTPAINFKSVARFHVPFKFLQSLVGSTVEDSGVTRLGARLVGITNVHNIKTFVEEPPHFGSWEYVISDGDIGVFECSSAEVNSVRQNQSLELYNKQLRKIHGERRERALIEVTIAEDSGLIGKSLLDFDFRRKYNACCIGIAKERDSGELKRWPLEAGDTLLLEGSKKEALTSWSSEGFFSHIVAIDGSAPPMRDTRKMVLTMGSLVLLVLLTSSEVIDIVNLGFIIVAGFISLRVITTREAWGSIKGDVLLTIAASFGIGQAMSNSGVARWVGVGITSICNGNELGILTLIYCFTVTLGAVLNNASVAVLVYPVAYSAAVESAGMDPELVVLLIIMGAGLSFCTPMSYQTNQMVQSPGGYLFSDYVRFGGSLQIATGVASVLFLYFLANAGFIKLHHSAAIL